MTAPHTPLRTCIVTKVTKPYTELLRVVVDLDASARQSAATGTAIAVVVPDPARRLPGRGAWMTENVATCQQALARRAFQRALRLSTPVDASAVLDYVEHRGSHQGEYTC